MKKILTAKDLIDKIDEDFYAKHFFYLSVSSPVLFAETVAIEFAKLHVEAALKEASESVCTLDSIINSYPLENIK